VSDFELAVKAAELPAGGKKVVVIDDRLVALFHVGGKYYAIDDVCTHDGGPLAEGTLDGFEIICPRHGARFDIRDGRVLSMPATKDTVSHEVKVEGENVLVKLSD